MPITIDKIKEAQEKLNKVQRLASDMNEVLVKAVEAVLIREDGSIVVALTSAQKITLLAEYNIRKTALQTAVNELL